MSQRTYANGVLVEEWDDETLTYRRYSNGAVVEQRGYTAAETAAIVGAGAVLLTDRDFVVTDDSGNPVVRVGDMQHGDRGFEIIRSSGVPAFQMRKLFSPNDVQAIEMKDAQGNTLFAETAFGAGLERPYLPLPLQPVGGTVAVGPYGFERTVSTATFEDVFRWQGTRQNQWYRPIVNVRTTIADTAAEVRFVNASGAVMAPFLSAGYVGTAAAGVTTDREVKPGGGLEMNAAYGTEQVIRLQARRTAGTGNVVVSVRKSEGGSA